MKWSHEVKARTPCTALSCCVLSSILCFGLLRTIIYTSSSKMSGHGKLSRKCTVSTERPSSARPPGVYQCLSVSFCSMARYQPPRDLLHVRTKSTRWFSDASRQSPHSTTSKQLLRPLFERWMNPSVVSSWIFRLAHNPKCPSRAASSLTPSLSIIACSGALCMFMFSPLWGLIKNLLHLF